MERAKAELIVPGVDVADAIPKDRSVPESDHADAHDAAPVEVASDFGYPGSGSAASPDSKPGGIMSRIVWFALGALPLAVIATATTLVPAAEGHGTHTQLGLPPCGFLVSTGLPCPGCGLTTSFSHMVRFDWAGASAANAFGVALFLVSFFTIPVSFYSMWRGLPVIATMEKLQFEKVVVALAISSTLVASRVSSSHLSTRRPCPFEPSSSKARPCRTFKFETKPESSECTLIRPTLPFRKRVRRHASRGTSCAGPRTSITSSARRSPPVSLRKSDLRVLNVHVT